MGRRTIVPFCIWAPNGGLVTVVTCHPFGYQNENPKCASVYSCIPDTIKLVVKVVVEAMVVVVVVGVGVVVLFE
jgi:hypothetical protein